MMSRSRVLHAYTHHRGGGGAENSLQATVGVLRRNGVDVEIYCRSGEDHPRHLMGRLQAGLGALYSPSSVRRFSRVVDSFKPDIVHIHDLFPLISPWIAEECQKRGIPVVMTCVHYRLTCPIATHFRRGQVCTSCTGGREHWAVLHNCRGNLPRWPLVVGEVDTRSLKLVHSSVLAVDTQRPEDTNRGRLDLSHLTLLEDRENKQIILTYPRSYNAYKSNEWATVRLALK